MQKVELWQLSDYTVPSRGYIDKIYLHWTGGHYHQQFDDYHINIDGTGGIWIDGEFTDHKSHTWRRNTGAIGIALDCCYGATINKRGEIDYGKEPPTHDQLAVMAQVVAKLCVEIGLDIDSCVLTHAEVADIDGYGLHDEDPDMRWDLICLGDSIRSKAKAYAYAWRH